MIRRPPEARPSSSSAGNVTAPRRADFRETATGEGPAALFRAQWKKGDFGCAGFRPVVMDTAGAGARIRDGF